MALYGTARMDVSREDSVVDPDSLRWDVKNLFVRDGSFVLTEGGVSPHLVIRAPALQTADRIEALARWGDR